MRKYVFIFSASFLLFLLSCSLFEKDPYYFRVEIDSLKVPDTIFSGDTLEIKLYGLIGNNGCYSFDRFCTERDSMNVELSVRGRKVHSDVCPQVMIYLDTSYMALPPFDPGTFEIEILQPASIPSLYDSVIVR